jgi:hypothetical protein
MALAQRRQVVSLSAGVALAAIVGLIAFGLPALDRALPNQEPIAAGVPYPVGGGVTIRPPADAFVDVTVTRPGSDRGTALFLLGPIRYAVTVAPYDGELAAAVARLRQKITETSGFQVAGPERTVSTGSGLTGMQGGYTAPGRGGQYAVFLAGARVIEVTVSGDTVDLGRALPDVEATTRSIRVGGAR